MSEEDPDYWQGSQQDIHRLYQAVNSHGAAYKFVKVPNYNDPNDAVANNIMQALYPGRKVVGIDCRNLFANGGMVHCVTQQQPR